MQGTCRFPIHPTLSVVERQVTRVDATVLSHSWRLRSWTTLKILRDPTGALKHIPRAFHSACAHEITHLTSIERHAKTKLWEQASSRDCAPLACLNEYSLVWLNVCITSAHVGLDCPTEFCVLSFFFLGEHILLLNVPLSCEAFGTTCSAAGGAVSSSASRRSCNTFGVYSRQLASTPHPRSPFPGVLAPQKSCYLLAGQRPGAIDVPVEQPPAPSVASQGDKNLEDAQYRQQLRMCLNRVVARQFLLCIKRHRHYHSTSNNA